MDDAPESLMSLALLYPFLFALVDGAIRKSSSNRLRFPLLTRGLLFFLVSLLRAVYFPTLSLF